MIDILSQQISGVFQNSIFNAIIPFASGVESPILRASISRVAEELTVFTMFQTKSTINDSLVTYQRDLKGIYNPLNNVPFNPSNRRQQVSLQNNLVGIYGKQIGAQVENKAVMLIRDELRGLFPHSEFINFDVLTDTIIQFFSPAISGVVTSSIGQVTSNYFVSSTINTITNSISSLTSIYGAIQNLGQINSPWEFLFIGNVVGSAITDAQKFITGSQGDNNKLQVLNRGFMDPSAHYPLPEYQGRSEVNKLAQGDISNTIVISKDLNRAIGAPLPNGESFEQPIASFNGQYPYNKVTQTESGHIIEIDDTPGAERLQIYHRSGTFVEIDSNGSIIKRATGSNYEIIDRNGKISIAGKADISVSGACNIFVGNDANIEVDGDTNITCYNDVTAQVGGTFNVSATEEINMVSKNINLTATENFNILSDDKMNVSSVGEMDILSDAKTKISSSGLDILSENDISINSEEDLRLSSENNVVIHPDGGILLAPGSVVQVTTVIGQGSGDNMITFKLDNATGGVSESSFDRAQKALKSIRAKLGMLEGRKHVQPIDLKDPTPLTHVDNYTLLVEEEGQDAESHRNFIITNGIASEEIYDRLPVASERTINIPYMGREVAPSRDLINVNELPGNYRLTPSFTVEMLSDKAAITKDMIVSSDDLKYGEIIYNLQSVALNVLEPAYALYPNLLITSAYRNPERSNNRSQHTKGQAVDIQFRGVSYDDYYQIALKLAGSLAYDQFILEYTSYSRNPWIHISYSNDINRKSVMTFWNNKKYDNGIHRLS